MFEIFDSVWKTATQLAAEVSEKVATEYTKVKVTVSNIPKYLEYTYNAEKRKIAIKKAKAYLKKLPRAVLRGVKIAVKDILRNWQAVTILGLATIGVAFLIGELPFTIALPMFMKEAAVIGVLSVLAIKFLVNSMEKRSAN